MRKTGLTVAVVALLFLLAAAPARAATTWGISDGQVVPSLTVPGHDGGYSYNTIYLGKGGGTISGSIADGSGTDFYLVIKDNPGQNGASILRLTGNNQGYSGTIDLDAGILSIGNADALVQNLSNLHFNGVQSQALTDARIATTEALRNNWTAYTSGAAETALTGLMTAIDAQRQLGSVDMDDYNPDVYGVGTLVIEAGVHVVRDGFGSTSQQIDMNRYFLMSGQGWKKGTAAFHLEDGATLTIQNSRAQVNSGGILNVITDNIVTMTADGDGRYFFKDSADIAVNNEGTLVLQKATLSGNTAGAFANKATAFLSDMEFSNNTGTAVSNESHLVMTDYSISGNDTGIYNSGKLLLQTSAGETSTIKENTTGVLIAGSVANKGVIIVDGAGTTDMQDGLQPITYDDPVASIDKYGTGTWKLGNSFTVTGASEIDFTVHDGTLHLYRQGEVTGVNAGAIDFSGAGNSSFSVTDAAVLSIGGGNTIKGNATIAAKMVTFDMTGATTTDARLTIDSAVDFSPEAVNITNTSGLTTSDYLLVQAEAGGLSGFTTKLYQDGVEYVPARSSKAGDTMIGLKTSVDNSQLSLGTADATQNTTVYWNPGATNLWDVATTANWEGTVNGMNISTFLNNDSVFFSQFFEGPVTVAPSGVTVTTMNMQGSYTFTGGDITGTGSLIVSGGSNVTFANRLNMNEINLTSYIETITFAPAADWTLNSVIIGGGNVVMDAAEKTLTLAAANTYTGTTHVKSGTLAVADAAGIASSTQVTVDENATLAFTAAGASTIKDIRGAGILEKRGTGDLSVESGQFSGFIDMKQTGAVFRKTSTGIFEFSGNGSGGSFSLDAGAVIFDDAFWYGDFTAANGTRLDVATESTLRGSATFTGATLGLSDTLNVIVSARLDNATLDLDLATGGKLSSDGAVTLTNANTLNITNWVNGEHLVIESGSGITTGGTLGVTVNGQAITSSRLDAVVEMRDSDKQMYLTTTSTNYAFTWTGATNNTWDYGSANWFSPDTSDTAIIAGDKVIFEQATEGTIDIASGGVQVSEVSVTGDYTYTGGGINVAANSVGDGTFRIENGASVTFDNAANSFENGISVETGGTLAFTRANQLGSGTLSFESGATTFVSESFTDTHVANAITLAGTTAVEANGHLFLTGTVSGAGGLSILDNSVVQLVGVNTYAAGTLVENATLLAGNAKALGTGLITAVDSAVYYAFINTDSAADYADLVGKTTLTRSDLFLLGDSSESFGDSLALAAADAGSQVKLDGAFTLNGNAGIDAKSASLILISGSSLTVTGGGTSTLASGDTLFNGDVTVESDSILAVTGSASFDTSSSSLRLVAGAGQAPGQFHAVNGDINLSGSDNLNFTIDGATADVTGKIVIVADNAVDIIERLGSSLFRLAVQNNNEIFVEGLNSLEEVLEGILEPGQFAGNIGSGAGHFDTVMLDSSTPSSLQSSMMDTFQAVTALSDTDAMVNALRQTFGEYAVEAVEAPRHNLDRFQSQIAGRLASQTAGLRIARAVSGSGEAMASFASCAVPLANRIWGGGFGVWADQDTRDNVAGYKYRAGGFILGYERIIDDRFTVGFAGAYTRGNTKSKGLATEYDSDNINLGLYASYNHESNFYARAGIDFGYSWNDYDVNLIAGGRKSGDFESQTYSARLELGYDWEPVCNTFITPYVGITYAHVKQDDWRETGTADALTNWFDKSSMDVVDIPVGMRLTRVFPLGGGRYIAPEVHTAWIHSAGDKQATLTTGYNGSSIANALRGINPGRNRWQVGASLKARLTERFDASVDYTYQTRSGYDDHSVYMSMGLSF